MVVLTDHCQRLLCTCTPHAPHCWPLSKIAMYLYTSCTSLLATVKDCYVPVHFMHLTADHCQRWLCTCTPHAPHCWPLSKIAMYLYTTCTSLLTTVKDCYVPVYHMHLTAGHCLRLLCTCIPHAPHCWPLSKMAVYLYTTCTSLLTTVRCCYVHVLANFSQAC